jgi:hypothetical protein
MHVGIVGSGRIGRTLAGHLVDLGHEVALANSRGPDSLTDLVAELGDGARAATVEEAARFADLIFEAVPFGAHESLPREVLAGKTVVSASNYYPDRDGELDLGGRSHTEVLADHLDGSTVVKAFNTMYWATLRDEARPETPVEDRLVIFLAGDDADAKAAVADLVEAMGFAPVDVGSLADGAVMEPGSDLYNDPMTPAEARRRLAALD